MLPTIFLTLTAAVAGIIAAPVRSIPTRSLNKRATPIIGPGFTAQETQQLLEAHRDAMQLASYAVSFTNVDSILNKYFKPGDHQTVIDLFNRILNDDPQTEVGNPLLGDISIVVDYEDDDGDMACDGETMAELRDWSTPDPKLVVCAGPGFGHGGIGKGYTDVDTVECGRFDDRVSWKMETLGSILLHEYTHFYNLVVPPLSKETDDSSYGVFNVRHMDKDKATNNADSYSWFATENLWTILCHKEYQDPTWEDANDPTCDDNVCKAKKGS